MDLRAREEWGATYNVDKRPLMTGLPVSTVYVHHSVTIATGNPDADMRDIERIDIERFGVPSYSWGVHPSGVVLEGMGLHRGAHTIDNAKNSFNNIAFGLMFMGDFRTDQPTDAALHAAGELLALQEARGNLQAGWVLRGHLDVYATVCPGPNLYPRLAEIRALASLGDDMTDDEHKALYELLGYMQNVAPATGRIELALYALGHSSSVDLVNAIAAKLPGVSADSLKQAVKEAMREGTG